MAEKWKNEFKDLMAIYRISDRRLKVAILDSGIDSSHPGFAGEDRIKVKETWIGGDPGKDSSGHGTHVAGIILELTSNVDLYIGKVTESRRNRNKGQFSEVTSLPESWL
jgi:subtilisin family serine protease